MVPLHHSVILRHREGTRVKVWLKKSVTCIAVIREKSHGLKCKMENINLIRLKQDRKENTNWNLCLSKQVGYVKVRLDEQGTIKSVLSL